MGTDGELERMTESFQTPFPPPQPSSQPLTPSSALEYKEARSAATSALEANVSEDGLRDVQGFHLYIKYVSCDLRWTQHLRHPIHHIFS